YATGDMLATLAGKQWLPLVKPWPTRPAVEGGLHRPGFDGDIDYPGRDHWEYGSTSQVPG
ncbi:hypothetical protein ACIQD2_18330, partial [Dietzia maris]